MERGKDWATHQHPKTKVLHIGFAQECILIRNDQQGVKEVDEFTYLGILIAAGGMSYRYVFSYVGKAYPLTNIIAKC